MDIKSGGSLRCFPAPSPSFPQLFEYSRADASEAVFYPSYDLSDFSWDSINRTVNHTALTAELRGVPNSDPGGSFSNGSLAFRVRPAGRGHRSGEGTSLPAVPLTHTSPR